MNTQFMVGGSQLQFLPESFRKIKSSLFGKLVQNKEGTLATEDGSIIIDREKAFVEYIIAWDKYGEIPTNHLLLIRLLEEAEYYKLNPLVKSIELELGKLEHLEFKGFLKSSCLFTLGIYLCWNDLIFDSWCFYFSFNKNGKFTFTTKEPKVCWGNWKYEGGVVKARLINGPLFEVIITKEYRIVRCGAHVFTVEYFDIFAISETISTFKWSDPGNFVNILLADNVKQDVSSDAMVKFNVGGSQINLSEHSLKKFPDSLFLRLHCNNTLSVPKDKDGSIIINREVSKVVLESIVKFIHGEIPSSKWYCEHILEEDMLFFGLYEFVSITQSIPQNSLQFDGTYIVTINSNAKGCICFT